MSCAECDRQAVERGLCHACYQRHRYHGDLDRFAFMRTQGAGMRLADVLAEVAFLCVCRCHTDQPTLHGNQDRCACGGRTVLAQRLGMSPAALTKALWRARKTAGASGAGLNRGAPS